MPEQSGFIVDVYPIGRMRLKVFLTAVIPEPSVGKVGLEFRRIGLL